MVMIKSKPDTVVAESLFLRFIIVKVCSDRPAFLFVSYHAFGGLDGIWPGPRGYMD